MGNAKNFGDFALHLYSRCVWLILIEFCYSNLITGLQKFWKRVNDIEMTQWRPGEDP